MEKTWYATKDASKHKELIKQAKEPDVVEAVLNEIGKVGAGLSGVKEN